MPGTFEKFYKKFGQPQDYERAKVLCDEADQLIEELQFNSLSLRFSEVDEKASELIRINRVLRNKYFIGQPSMP